MAPGGIISHRLAPVVQGTMPHAYHAPSQESGLVLVPSGLAE